MDRLETGKLIAKLRKEAGYTQKALADALFVTDKAVSKWERGLCLPDASLLTKLSMMLDADIEYLIAGNVPYGEHKWVGELRVDDLRGTVAGKPLIHYLLSYFMLVGITDIAILTNDKEYVKSLGLEKYGLNISYMSFHAEKTMIVYDKFFLFGLSMTRRFQRYMTAGINIVMELHGKRIPIAFLYQRKGNGISWNQCKYDTKQLGRGNICFPLKTEEEIKDVSEFVKVYERYHGCKIADLNEIARLRGLL